MKKNNNSSISKYKKKLKLLFSRFVIIKLLLAFQVNAQVTSIVSFNPISSVVGSSIIMSGSGFNTTAINNIVFFGATKATVTQATANSLTITVPVGATYAPITVLNTQTFLSAQTLANFNPIYAPAKTSITTSDFMPKQDFTEGLSPATTYVPTQLKIGDLDGDGKADLVVANGRLNTVSVFHNTSTNGTISSSSFATKVDFTVGTSAYSVAIGDLNADGKPDLAVTNVNSNTVSVLRNTSNIGSITSSSFASKIDFITGSKPISVAIGDLDGDGKHDLVVANEVSNTLSVFHNTSNNGSIVSGSFATKVDFTTGAGPYSVAIADLDSDGKPELVSANSSSASVSVFKNTSSIGVIGSSSFSTKFDFLVGGSPGSLAIGDLNGDGKPELAVALIGPTQGVSLLRNKIILGSTSYPSSSFADYVLFNADNYTISIGIGDLDGDGKPDLAVSNYTSNTVSVLRNTITMSTGNFTSSSFATKVDFATGSNTGPYSIAIGDLDGDGKPDFATANIISNTLSVFRNRDLNTITLSSALGTNAQDKCINNAISTITYSTTGATGATVSGLPSGCTGSWFDNVFTITGTPTVLGTFNYSIQLIGGCGSVNATGTITVEPTITVGTASSMPIVCVNTMLPNIIHTTISATGIGTPTGIPSGVFATWSSNTITISGIPTVSGIYNYSIPLTGGCGVVNATGTITVIKNTWLGSTSSEWNVDSNWSCGTVPSDSQEIIIATSTPNVANLNINFTLASAGTLIISDTGSLTIDSQSVLTIAGTADFGGKSVIIKSDASGTGAIGAVTGVLNGASNVTVERYIPARRAWRMLTAPLSGTENNTIPVNWQGTTGEGLLLWSPAIYQTNAMIGYTNGEDSPNIWKYNSGWIAIPNLTTETMYSTTPFDTKSYLVFATGGFESPNITTGATATTLRPKGQLITGTVAHTGLATGTFHAIANPYASAISSISLIGNNQGQKMWLIDPTLGSVGGYFAYDGANWVPTTPIGNDLNIQSGQGIFIRSATATSFTISETDKVIGSSNTWFERNSIASTNEVAPDKIRVLLYKEVTSQWKLADGILSINYATGTSNVDEMDTNKISNFNESIMFRNNNTNLSIEHRALPQLGDIQPIRITATTTVPYQLRVSTENYSNSNLQPFIEDTQTGTFTEIPIDGATITIPFTGIVSSISAPDNRFRIVYQSILGNDTKILTGVKAFPNPVVNRLLNINLGTNVGTALYTITNVLGQCIQRGTLENLENVIMLTSISKGNYILNIVQERKQYTTKILVK